MIQVQKVEELFYKADPEDGLFSLTYSRTDGSPASSKLFFIDSWKSLNISRLFPEFLTAGSMADSGYEYFLKQWILTGDVQARNQCEDLIINSPK